MKRSALLAPLPALLLALQGCSLAAQQPGIGMAVAAPTGARSYQLEPGKVRERVLRERFTPEQVAILEKLNRADFKRLGGLEQIVVPVEWLGDELEYSPFPPEYAWAAAHPKALVVDQPAQAFAAYEHGRLVRWGPISSGRRPGMTPSGLFHLTWRSRGHHSSVDPEWYMPWYFNFHRRRGLAFHQYKLPGHPASHACIRLLERDAVWLYKWGEGAQRAERGREAEPGTPVLILGQYDFGAPPPWRSPEWLARGVELPVEVPATRPAG